MRPSSPVSLGLAFWVFGGFLGCETAVDKPMEPVGSGSDSGLVDCDGDGPLDTADLDVDGFSTCQGDCDDADPNTHPGAAGMDSDVACMSDADGDGYGAMLAPDGGEAGTDCSDSNAGLHPFVDAQGIERCGWREVSAGWHHTCGVDSKQGIQCWGSDASDQLQAPAGEFLHVAGGERHTCGLELGGSVVCWGDNTYGESSAPEGLFSSITTGGGFSCGLQDGVVVCWGQDSQGQVSGVPAGSFVQVSAGQAHACALDAQAAPHCWGWDADGQATAPELELTMLEMGTYHSCGLDPEGALRCWGRGYEGEGQGEGGGGEGEAPIEMQAFLDVGVSAFHTCMVTTEEELFCLGVNEQGQSRPPLGLFQTVATGVEHSCGLDVTGAVSCWGSDEWGQSAVP